MTCFADEFVPPPNTHASYTFRFCRVVSAVKTVLWDQLPLIHTGFVLITGGVGRWRWRLGYYGCAAVTFSKFGTVRHVNKGLNSWHNIMEP